MKSGIAAASFVLACACAMAQEPAPTFAPTNATREGVRGLASACMTCHGPEGRPAAGSDMPALASRPEVETMRSMSGYKRGAKPGTIMPQIAKGYTDPEIEAIARYFAHLNAKP